MVPDCCHLQKHFKQKNLIILRSCNELLRRLSRAEDTVFCGRVFIFLFQSFPLGDKSSVNLRGEYHVENITTFDELSAKQKNSVQDMEVDHEGPDASTADVSRSQASVPSNPSAPLDPPSASSTDLDQTAKTAKNVTFDAEEATQEPLDMDTLYPTFWTLQQDFSNPTRLFESARFDFFKKGLESTIAKFKDVQSDIDTNSTINAPEDRRGTKRKRGERGEDLASSFNPKYLTSRDLFELEVRQLLRCF
jgi:THO complex subunit 1